MGRIVSILMFIILTVVLFEIVWWKPAWLSDRNDFLKGFVNQELLAILGVIVTITLASAGNLHLELNRIEDLTGERFAEARRAIRAYTFLLIALFVAAVVIVVVKPLASERETAQAVWNSLALLIVALNVASLLDLTNAILSIPADRRLRDSDN